MYAPVKTYLKKGRKLLISKSFLFLLNGFLLASLFYFHSENVYEQQLFKTIAASISAQLPTSQPAREDSILAKSMDMSHRLLKRRMTIFGNGDFRGLKAEVLQPVAFDLMTGKGACGSNAYVLGRLLQEFDMQVRFPHMKVNGVYGGHILIEAKSTEGWKVLDPVYDLTFKRPDGKLASFQDVKQNWNYYKLQVPKDYKTEYSYADAQYTNWNKIPVLMPLLKHFLYLVKGEGYTNHLSLRSFILRKYKLAFDVTLILYLLLTASIIRLFIRRRKKTIIQPEIHNIKAKHPSLATVYN